MPYYVELTRDIDLIRQVIAHPDIFPHISEDRTPDILADLEFIARIPFNHFLKLCFADGTLAGLFFCHGHSMLCGEVHLCIFPEHQGQATKALFDLALEWVFTHTPLQQLFARCADSNPKANRVAERSGFDVLFQQPDSWLKRGRWYGQTVYQITLHDWMQGADSMRRAGLPLAEFLKGKTDFMTECVIMCRYLGFVQRSFQAGQPLKGQVIYNEVASLLGYPLCKVELGSGGVGTLVMCGEAVIPSLSMFNE